MRSKVREETSLLSHLCRLHSVASSVVLTLFLTPSVASSLQAKQGLRDLLTRPRYGGFERIRFYFYKEKPSSTEGKEKFTQSALWKSEE